MNPSDFPAFMTVRNLIMMVDASIPYPFFKRNRDGKIKGQTEQNTWHNEQKGTLYINSYFKNRKMQVGKVSEKDFQDIEEMIDREDPEEEEEEAFDENDENLIGERFLSIVKQ